ncbi:MAG: preprotein translocase subunit SecG [Pyrinomonadaceae bacterium MAG19_C2-C3]|nr:preprotein translocase subunit SecG [Pyrinomonadaceae bacterium MAG19_C2-C3]
MLFLLYTVFVIACVVLVVAVLLQPGKADAGALFTNSISSTAFGPRGTQTLLAKIGIGAAATFMLLAIVLSLPALTGSRSVLESVPAGTSPLPSPTVTASPASETPAENNVTPPANTADAPNAAVEAIPSPASTTTEQPAANTNNATPSGSP